MRHQDQQQTHSLNLDMNFLDTKKKLIRIESHFFLFSYGSTNFDIQFFCRNRPRKSDVHQEYAELKNTRVHVRDSKKDENELWTCPFCNNKSITRNNYIRHLSVHKGDPIKPWESVKVKGHQSANVENWEPRKQATESPVFINATPTMGRSGSVLQVTNRNIYHKF